MEELDVVRAVLEAAARGDTDAVLAHYDPAVEWDVSRGGLAELAGAGVFHGHEGLRSFFRSWRDAVRDGEYLLDELFETGGHVISDGRLRGRGFASGIELERAAAAVWTVREGRIVRVRWFSSRAEALAAAD